MCGVFGFVSKAGKPVSLKTLRDVARVTQRRGPHAWGMAWLDGLGRMHMYKQTGKVVDALPLLAMAHDARLLIGHCRWATHGDPANNLNNHPHPADGGWFVHNGVVSGHEGLALQYDLHPVTECDSEVLGLLIAQGTGRMIDRVARAVRLSRSRPLAVLGLWKPGNLVFARRGNPLHRGDATEGTYLASLPDGLPGKVKSVPDDEVFEYTLEGFANAGV
jgi:glucosamine--fructose-6-phosphate aminotransferase (isomerizing)